MSEVQDDETESSEDEDSDSNEIDSVSHTEGDNDEESDEDEPSSDLEDNVAYQDWLQEAKEATNAMWSKKYEKYVNEGLNEDQAKEKADRKTRWAVKRNFFDNYKDFLSSYLNLKGDDTHQEVLEDLEDKLDKGLDVNNALSRVMPKHQSKFDGLFQQDEEDDNESDNEDSSPT
jgi:hypothetical protein